MMTGRVFLLEFGIAFKKGFDCIQFYNGFYLKNICDWERILLQLRVDSIDARNIVTNRLVSNTTGHFHILFKILNQHKKPSFQNSSEHAYCVCLMTGSLLFVHKPK